jgi:hypothetical protein
MKPLALLLFTALAATIPGCATPTVPSERPPITQNESPVVLSPFEAESKPTVAWLLRHCPSWLHEDDPKARAFILYRYFEISKRPTAEIRSGVMDFLEGIQKSNLGYLEEQDEIAKIPLLSRLIFAEPLYLTEEEGNGIYFTWISPRLEGGCYKWVTLPLGLDQAGSTIIRVSRNDYSSPPNVYFLPEAVIKEFDSLSTKFGRSNLRMSTDGKLLRQPSEIPEKIIRANQSPEATPSARTPAADGPVAPAVGRASS